MTPPSRSQPATARDAAVVAAVQEALMRHPFWKPGLGSSGFAFGLANTAIDAYEEALRAHGADTRMMRVVDADELPDALTPPAIDQLFAKDDLYTARAVFARLKSFGYVLTRGADTREAVIEECAKHLENEADVASNSLHCGDNHMTIAAVHRVSRAYYEAAKALRLLSRSSTGSDKP